MCEEGVALADAGRARVGAAGVPALAVVDEHGAGLGRGRVDELGRVSGRDRGEHRAVRARDLRRHSVSTGGADLTGWGRLLTMRVPPLCGPVSLSIQTVFIMTGSCRLSMCSGMSPCKRCAGSPGRTMREESEPRMQSEPRK